MSSSINLEDLEELVKGKGIDNIQQLFENLIIAISDELKLNPLSNDIKIATVDSKDTYDDPFRF
jgi:hypothetical protein